MTREEAINEIKKSWDFLKRKEMEALCTLIPELAESEDEKIRKEIMEFISSADISNYVSEERQSEWYHWLEKQKEQKPAEWSQKDEDMLKCICSDLLAGSAFNIKFQIIAKEKINWLKTRLRSCYHH